VSEESAALIRKLWQYCGVLRDDGLSYPDYVEQLTYLLFLKMAEEGDEKLLPEEQSWSSFAALDAKEMRLAYDRILSELSERDGILGLIFGGARNKISDPMKLRVLVVDLVGRTDWSQMTVDVKGDAYEGLLEKNARDTKSGAGQYFTPRPLVDAVVECVDPRPGERISDPACGTGGFLLAAHAHLTGRKPRLTKRQLEHTRTEAIRGVELVREVARLAAMNLFLHGIGNQPGDPVPITCADSLREAPSEHAQVILTNPPFGTKGTVGASEGRRGPSEAERELVLRREDFPVRTNNKQLNFVQHIMSLLSAEGRAAVVVPDNVLFEGGGAAAIRRRLVEEFDVHTLLRLPAGLFYAAGVLANVLFFDGPEARKADRLWVYDFRSGNRFSLKARPLRRQDLDEFVDLYLPGKREKRAEDGSRWRSFGHDEILKDEDARLDLDWVTDDEFPRVSSNERIEQLGAAITGDLKRALDLFGAMSEAPRSGD
jgi:type I restriction enzyme M protein